MPPPSPYLQTTWVRWADRGVLARRELEMALEDIRAKGRALAELRQTIGRHRLEDLKQLSFARQETWIRWDERLRRLKEWSESTQALHQESRQLVASRDAARWLDRAPKIAQRYARILDEKAARFEKDLIDIHEKVGQWSDRLALKEAEVRRFIENEAIKSTEILVSSARKRAHLDFVYNEKDEEARLARQLRILRSRTDQLLQRISGAERRLPSGMEVPSAVFEVRKKDYLDTWRPAQERFSQLNQDILKAMANFEDGRQRLRWIYETARRMRVVETSSPRRRPLLERLFKFNPD